VSYLIDAGINAVGLSPGISYPNLQAHGGNEQEGVTTLVLAIKQALGAGLIPVLHGDAGLYGDFTNGRRSMGAGILSGDTLLEVIATHELMKPYLSRAVFLTDVEGVYSRDPKLYNDVQLLKVIEIDKLSGRVITDVLVTGSTHEHDVTGGLTVSTFGLIQLFLKFNPKLVDPSCYLCNVAEIRICCRHSKKWCRSDYRQMSVNKC
jgi:isopentenyl phosphate kinase